MLVRITMRKTPTHEKISKNQDKLTIVLTTTDQSKNLNS